MKRKILSVILSLCIVVCALPLHIFATAEQTEMLTFAEGKTLILRNEYISFYFYDMPYQSYTATVPTAIAKETGEIFTQDLQSAYCKFIIQSGDRDNKTYPILKLKKAEFTNKTPNGENPAIKAEYSLQIGLYNLEGIANGTIIPANVTVYHELVRLDDGKGNDASWGVLTTVGNIQMNIDDFPEVFPYDFAFEWIYIKSNFTGMGHNETTNSPGGPAIKMSRTTITESGERTTENSVVTSRIDDLSTKHVPKGYTSWGDIDGIYITEVYTSSYPWANSFVGLSDYYETNDVIYDGKQNLLHVRLPQSVSVQTNDFPCSTWIESRNYVGFTFDEDSGSEDGTHYLWGFHDLVKFEDNLPTNPDKVSSTFSAKRLAAFKSNGGIVVEYVRDDASLESLKKKYNTSPIVQIGGEYESTNGSAFEFKGGAAMLSPSVTAVWNEDTGGKLVVHKDGRIEQHGVHLNAPSFKFYQPKDGAETLLKIAIAEEGLVFDIEPDKNDAVIFVDIPYATAKLEKATADIDGNLVFSGEIGFKTIFDGAEFSLEKLGYGLKEKMTDGKKEYDFKVNGVKAKGCFDTAALMTLELAKVEGEVNTFKGEERYDFSLELNAFELFETEAKLALERSSKGTLLPDELWFYVKASPGIVLVPPVPIGQLNGGGAGFKDLAATVNGNYLAIPPIKLRGALTGTYLHLIEGTGNVVIGPSEISLKATDVNIVGAGETTQIIESFGYALKLNGQERNYKGSTYKGIYFGGSKELELNLPSKAIDVIEVDALLELGAFGGLNDGKDKLYLAIGANGTVKGLLKTPVLGVNLGEATVNLVVGGQMVVPIRGVSVNEGFKDAFDNIDMYLGAMAEARGKVFAARAWVLIPRIVQTNFRKGEGWDVEVKLARKFRDWNWEDRGVTPVVMSAPQMFALANAPASEADISVTVNSPDETPYILLSFDNNITEQDVKAALAIEGKTIHWAENGDIDPTAEINAITDVMTNKKDGKQYRVVLLNLSSGGNYHISAGGIAFKYEQANETPFERLNLALSADKLTGEVKYAEADARYVLRTYLADKEGGADYIIEEQEISDLSNIEISIPSSGALAPTGEYYVTAFLMVNRQADINNDGKEEDVLIAIDNQAFSTKVSYINVNEPSAPTNITLQALGNETMRASWDAVHNADGYAVRIYEEQNGAWTDTGFEYDLNKDTTAIDMALTVGGNGVHINGEGNSAKSIAAEKLLPDRTYKVGIRAYKRSENGKYYSKETESLGEFLPKYTPMEITLSVNGNACVPDENGVYHAYVGGGVNTLAVSSSESGAAFKVTRMDTNTEISAGADGKTFTIPEFEGSLMFKIDGIFGNDITSVFLLVSIDKEPPVLTLSSDVFYADKETGEYTITGMSHAGSRIIYGNNEEAIAGGDGRFTVPGKLRTGETSDIVMMYAQDSAANTSRPQKVLITKKISNHVTVNGSYAENSGSGEYSEGETVTIKAGEHSGYTFSGWTMDNSVQLADSMATETTFTMPGRAVTVTAKWMKSDSGSSSGGATRYTVSFETDGGSKLSSQIVTGNNVVKEPASPVKEGFDFAGWYIDKELKTKYDFSAKVTKSFTLYAKWTEKDSGGKVNDNEWENPFVDIKKSDWFYNSVKYTYENDLMNGISNTEFAPDSDITRAMFVTIIYRIEQEPQTENHMFTDIESGSYYEKAVAWANANGIVSGISKDRFAPDEPITREQMATIIYRYAVFKGYDIKEIGNTIYTDDNNISDYAKKAINWAAERLIMTGNTDGSFAPKTNTTRAESAAVFMRMLKNLK